MKNKTAGKILFAVFAVALCVAAYFAADLAFFQYDDPVERATLSVANDGEALSFTYDNDAVTLHSGDNTTVYALTYSGTAVVENTYIESLPSDFAGSFAAVQTGIREDTNGDGVTENITRVAKTDMEYTRGYDATANSFLSDEIPFEVVYKDRESFTVYYNSESVKNSEITVTLADGTVKTLTTDENGDITGLNLNDVRNGLTFTYRPDALNTYSINYQVEADTIFTTRWLSAMLPFGIIILVSAVCITLDVLLRKLLYKKEKLPVGKTGVMARDKRRKRFVFGFESIRWIVMILSFALLIFGSRLTGTVFSNVQLPVISLIARKYDRRDILSGMHLSMAKRIIKMMKKSEKNGDVLMTGGGALNIGLRKAFEDELMRDVFVANHPQFNGAIGAALLASERG